MAEPYNYTKSFFGGNFADALDAGPSIQIIDPTLPTPWGIQQTLDPLEIDCIESVAPEFITEKGDLVCGSQGTTPADRFITGQSFQVLVTYQDTSLELMERVLQGFDLVLNGDAVVGAMISRAIGQKDSDIAAPVQFQRIIDSVASTDPLNHLTIPLAAPLIETFTITRNNADQITWECSFMAYPSIVVGGRQVLAVIGDLNNFVPDDE